MRDGRALAGTRGHIFPGEEAVSPLLQWTHVPARAQADVPVLYPRAVAETTPALSRVPREGREETVTHA